MANDEPKTHLFLEQCGCLAAAIVDDWQTYPDLARQFRQAHKYHLIYKFVQTEEVRKMAWKCPQHQVNQNS